MSASAEQGALTDHIRGQTFFLNNVAGDKPELKLELCPGARVYAYEIEVRSDAAIVPDVLATLQLQDSKISVYSFGCRIRAIHADLPGLAWPAFAKLIAETGSAVELILTYGNCA